MLGTCCANCLPAKVRAYALNAQNGAVTVKPIENLHYKPIEDPSYTEKCSHIIGRSTMTLDTGQVITTPTFCNNRADFSVTYHGKEDIKGIAELTAENIKAQLNKRGF